MSILKYITNLLYKSVEQFEFECDAESLVVSFIVRLYAEEHTSALVLRQWIG